MYFNLLKKNDKQSLSTKDLAFMVAVIGFSLYVLYSTFYLSNNSESIGRNFKYLSFCTSFIVIIFQYESLRKKIVFCVWSIIGLLHLFMFFWFRNSPLTMFKDENFIERHHSDILVTTALLLFFYQSFRRLSIFFYRQELEWFTSPNYWVDGGREANTFERVCSLILFFMPFIVYYFVYLS